MTQNETYNFDEQTFVEHYLRDYSSNQDIADMTQTKSSVSQMPVTLI